MYEKESCDLEAKLEQMKTDGKDPYDINKQVGLFAQNLWHNLWTTGQSSP